MLYRRDLSWTHGFPVAMLGRQLREHDNGKNCPDVPQPNGVAWIQLDSCVNSESTTALIIDRRLLRRSELAASRLRHQFPKAIRMLF